MKLSHRFYDEDAEAGTTGSTADTETTAEDISSGSAESSHTDSQPEPPAGADSQEAPAASAPAPHPSLADRIRNQFGVDYSSKYRDEDELLKGLVNASKLVGQRDEYSELGRLYAQEAESFKQYLRSRQGNGQQQPTSSPGQQPEQDAQKGWWNPPEWNEAWNKYLDPETGSPRDEAPLEIRRAAEQRADYIARWQHQLVFNPEKALEPLLKAHEERVIARINGQWQQMSESQRVQYEAQQIVEQNRAWMFEVGENGQIITDDRGNRMFTPAGLMYVDELHKLSSKVQDQQLANELAIRRVQERLGASAPKQAPVSPAAKRQPNSNAGKVNGTGKRVSDSKGLSMAERMRRAVEDIPEEQLTL